ncbi:MAG: cellulase family glycosylhydrolase [Oscillospiraceae bacterium]|nr:cellulase family glycosylhydrolase [Oscillospiraceae bacterium]
MKKLISVITATAILLSLFTLVPGVAPVASAQPVQTAFRSLVYNFTASSSSPNVSGSTVSLRTDSWQEVAAPLVANGNKVTATFTGVSAGGFISLGEIVGANPGNLTLDSIVVNGMYVVIPASTTTLSSSQQLPNRWSPFSVGDKFAASADGLKYIGVANDSGGEKVFQFFADPDAPLTDSEAAAGFTASHAAALSMTAATVTYKDYNAISGAQTAFNSLSAGAKSQLPSGVNAAFFTTLLSKINELGLPRSLDYAVNMGLGWNLGNSLDAFNSQEFGGTVTDWETAWGNPVVTKQLINTVKESGFSHIRIPFTVAHRGSDKGASTPESEIRYVIHPEWLARYKEVVQWAVDADLYVMVNLHHDSWFWLGRNHNENPMGGGWNGTAQMSNAHYRRFTDYWKQIADAFKDMPDTVMFETNNEPEFNAADPQDGANPLNLQRLDATNKAAYDIIRATPGNANRMIVIPTYKTNHNQSAHTLKFIQTDLKNDPNVIATVHYYGEWVFSNPLGRTIFDEKLFDQFDVSDSRTARNSIDDFFDILNANFVENGIGVSVGEWGLLHYDHNFGKDASQRGEELKYYEYVQFKARDFRGISLSFWDNGSGINRTNGEYNWNIPQVGAMLGCNERSSYSTGLDTTYFRDVVTADVNIPLTLNGNTFMGIQGLTQDTDYTYANGVVTLKKDYINGLLDEFDYYGAFARLVMQFSGGVDWEQYLVNSHVPAATAATGSRTAGLKIPFKFNGNKVRRVSCYSGAAPASVDSAGICGNSYPCNRHQGGNHGEWFPYLEYGAAYTVDYASGTLNLTGVTPNHNNSFFNNGGGRGLNGGSFTLVVEFYDGSRVDVTLNVAGDPVTSTANASSGHAAGPPLPDAPPLDDTPIINNLVIEVLVNNTIKISNPTDKTLTTKSMYVVADVGGVPYRWRLPAVILRKDGFVILANGNGKNPEPFTFVPGYLKRCQVNFNATTAPSVRLVTADGRLVSRWNRAA